MSRTGNIVNNTTQEVETLVKGAYALGLTGRPYRAYPTLNLDTPKQELTRMAIDSVNKYEESKGYTDKEDDPDFYQLLIDLTMCDFREYLRGLADCGRYTATLEQEVS